MSLEIRHYHDKNTYLSQYYESVTPLDFYRAVFPPGELERAGHPEDNKPNGILVDISDRKRPRRRLVFDDLAEIESVQGAPFVITSPITYSGRRRTGENARFMYAIAIDLDGTDMEHLQDLLHQIDSGILPRPTYLVNSGTGFHLYFVFDGGGLPMYTQAQARLKTLKFALIRRCWNRYTSDIDEPQMQGILQGFRAVGTQSKLGEKCPVVAYEIGDPVSLDYLNDFVEDAAQVRDLEYKNGKGLSLRLARDKYPEWYQARIVEGQPKGRWVVKSDLYKWWLRRIQQEITVGHRYFAIMCLAVFAKKCGIDEEQLEKDSFSLLAHFDGLTQDPTNKFTAEDVVAALEMYNENYVTFPRDDIARLSGLSIQPNKRNGRKQKTHLMLARAAKKADKDDGKAIHEGRPTERGTVAAYLYLHPDESNISKIARETKLSRPTVTKWYNELKSEKDG